MARETTESELKIPVNDLDVIRSSLADAKAEPVHSRSRESNLLLDTADHRLRQEGCVLRVRQYGGRIILTFKGPATFDGPVKVRAEHETGVAGLDDVLAILENLGFTVFMRYEKYREEWLLGEMSVSLDHTPMGDFIEVEGPVEELEKVARSLGLRSRDAVRGSYPSLWLEHRRSHPEHDLPFDMVFPG